MGWSVGLVCGEEGVNGDGARYCRYEGTGGG